MFDCKPLPVLWGRFPEYTPDNTIMFDDLRRNYVFNPQNGLVIRPYRYSYQPAMKAFVPLVQRAAHLQGTKISIAGKMVR